MRACEAHHEVTQGVLDAREQRLGDSRRQREAEAVAIPGHVLDGDEASRPTRRQLDGAAGDQQRLRPGCTLGLGGPGDDLVTRKVADAQQQVVDAIHAPRPVVCIEMLQLPLDVRHDVGVEQFPQLRIAEQLAELLLVDRQGLRPPLRKRRVAVVEVVRHIAEQQRCRKRRRRLRVPRDDSHAPRPHVVEQRMERRHVEEVPQALAMGLEHERKGGKA